MKRAISITLFFILAGIFLSSSLPSGKVQAISIQDLGISNPGLLPSNPFYFFKEWGRGLRRAVTFNELKGARLELNILNQRAAEIEKLTELTPINPATLEAAIDKYNKSINKLTIHEELLDQLVSYIIKHVQVFDGLESQNAQLAIKKLLNVLALTIKEYDTPEEFRARVKRVLEPDQQRFKSLRTAEVLDKLENQLPQKTKYSLARLKWDLLLDFAVEPDIDESFSGDFISYLRVLDQLRIKVGDTKLKSQLNLLRQNIAQKAEDSEVIDNKLTRPLIQEAQKIVKELTGRKAKTPLVKKLTDQAKFNLKQAEIFYKEAQFSAAIGQATAAIAAAKNALYYLLPGSDISIYENELLLLKQEYDRLENPVKEVEEKIINLADLLQSKNIKYPNEKIEKTLVDIKLFLSRMKYGL